MAPLHRRPSNNMFEVNCAKSCATLASYTYAEGIPMLSSHIEAELLRNVQEPCLKSVRKNVQ